MKRQIVVSFRFCGIYSGYDSRAMSKAGGGRGEACPNHVGDHDGLLLVFGVSSSASL